MSEHELFYFFLAFAVSLNPKPLVDTGDWTELLWGPCFFEQYIAGFAALGFQVAVGRHIWCMLDDTVRSISCWRAGILSLLLFFIFVCFCWLFWRFPSSSYSLKVCVFLDHIVTRSAVHCGQAMARGKGVGRYADRDKEGSSDKAVAVSADITILEPKSVYLFSKPCCSIYLLIRFSSCCVLAGGPSMSSVHRAFGPHREAISSLSLWVCFSFNVPSPPGDPPLADHPGVLEGLFSSKPCKELELILVTTALLPNTQL